MQILRKEDAPDVLKRKSLDAFLAQLSSELPLVKGAYSAPTDSGVQIALAKLIAYQFREAFPVCLYVTDWGIAMEHMDLFYRYRQSFGEKRPLIEAPVHVFERGDEDAFVSVLSVVLFFSWDASVFDVAGRSLFQTSHDGWLELRTREESVAKEVAAYLESKVTLLAP